MLVNNLPAYSGPYKQEDSVLLKIYYPSESNKLYNQLTKWASYPENRYLKGVLDYIKVPSIISKPLIYFLAGQPKTGSYISDGSDLLKDIDEFPVALFSHGLAGTRTFYSGICGELASHGIIVAAIEHRDGSAAYSYRGENSKGLKYKFPEWEEKSKEDLLFRQNQLLMRKQETKNGLKVLEMLNQGELKREALYLPDKKDKEFQYLKKLNENKEEKEFWFNGLSKFKNRLNLKENYLLGHSFGGATVLELLNEKDNPYKIGITFDPWMYPVTSDNITRPTLGIITNAFYIWKINFDSTLKLFRTNNNNQMYIQLNTKHIHQSDAPSLLENFVSKFKKLKISPKQALRDDANAALSFIDLYMDTDLKRKLKYNIKGNLKDSTKFTSVAI
ncbi:hypothetical protein K502DRAFT_349086 [Neoconidiobolus thromboides FSU 785]|nr:hypothetical protein K502DRAFT_349086 [Neoconidiobolus thromboides FSU 785]